MAVNKAFGQKDFFYTPNNCSLSELQFSGLSKGRKKLHVCWFHSVASQNSYKNIMSGS